MSLAKKDLGQIKKAVKETTAEATVCLTKKY